MSDYRIEFEEAFRFQELIASMRLPDVNDEEYLKLRALKWAEADERVDNVREWDRTS